MRRLAIIPARGGSKRILRKNIKDFCGKPIISYSIEAAIKTELFDEIMVSTDDEEIAEIAKKYGAKVPFMRSEANSDDYATTADVLSEVLDQYRKLGVEFDLACCLYPTAPLIQPAQIIKCFEVLVKNKFDTVFPVVKFSYPIQRCLKFEGEKIKMNEEQYLFTRSQDLEERFHDAGQFYCFDISKFSRELGLLTHNTGGVEVSEMQVQDIDNLTDWNLAELKFKLLNK